MRNFFSFEFVNKPKISKEINKLDKKRHVTKIIFQENRITRTNSFSITLYTTVSVTCCSALILLQN